MSIDGTNSYVGGHLLWNDSVAGNAPGELKPQAEAVAAAFGVPAWLIIFGVVAIGGYVDLDAHPELTICGSNENGTSIDSMSAAFRVGATRD
jgi:hypothetical protein